jgi:hypothetical protein
MSGAARGNVASLTDPNRHRHLDTVNEKATRQSADKKIAAQTPPVAHARTRSGKTRNPKLVNMKPLPPKPPTKITDMKRLPPEIKKITDMKKLPRMTQTDTLFLPNTGHVLQIHTPALSTLSSPKNPLRRTSSNFSAQSYWDWNEEKPLPDKTRIKMSPLLTAKQSRRNVSVLKNTKANLGNQLQVAKDIIEPKTPMKLKISRSVKNLLGKK